MSDNWFANFGGQPARSGGNHLNPGTYVITVGKIIRKIGGGGKMAGHQLVILEATIDETLATFEADPGNMTYGRPDWKASNQPGEKVSWVQDTQGAFPDTAFSNVKGLLLACVQAVSLAKNPPQRVQENSFTPQQWKEALMRATEPPGTMFAGVKLVATATKTRKKSDGGPFTPVTFAPYTGPARQGDQANRPPDQAA